MYISFYHVSYFILEFVEFCCIIFLRYNSQRFNSSISNEFSCRLHLMTATKRQYAQCSMLNCCLIQSIQWMVFIHLFRLLYSSTVPNITNTPFILFVIAIWNECAPKIWSNGRYCERPIEKEPKEWWMKNEHDQNMLNVHDFLSIKYTYRDSQWINATVLNRKFNTIIK